MSAITVASAQQVAISRCRGTMQFAGMNVSTVSTLNPDLNDPLATALEGLGFPPADRAAVADSDLAVINLAVQSRFFDLLEIRVLETCLNGIATKPSSQAWEDYKVDRRTMVKDLQTLLAWKREQYQDNYAANSGVAVGQMTPATQHTISTTPYWPRY